MTSRIPWPVWAFMTLALAASCFLELQTLSHLPVLCPFRAFTDLPCPGCGLTRSFVATAHGDLAGAFQFHLFGPLLFAASALALLLVVFRRHALARSVESGVVRAVESSWIPLSGIFLIWAIARVAFSLG